MKLTVILFVFGLSRALFAQPAPAPWPADKPQERFDLNSKAAHHQLEKKAHQGRVDIYFEGDSIVRRWGATDYPDLLANWNKNFHGWNAGDFGWGADMLQNVLWRLNKGELDGINPKIIVLLAGTNNVGNTGDKRTLEEKAADIQRGFKAILKVMRAKAPDAVILLTALFPRNDHMALMPLIQRVNGNLAQLADGKNIRFLNINGKMADSSGNLFDGVMNADKLHPALKGYQIWADALKPILTELLGKPGKEDLAPPPTGNPGIK